MCTATLASTNGWMALIRGKKLSWKVLGTKRARKVGLKKVVEAALGNGKAVLAVMLLLGDEF